MAVYTIVVQYNTQTNGRYSYVLNVRSIEPFWHAEKNVHYQWSVLIGTHHDRIDSIIATSNPVDSYRMRLLLPTPVFLYQHLLVQVNIGQTF